MMEAIDCFVIVLTARDGRILYASEGITPLVGYIPSDILNMCLYDLISDSDKETLYNTLLANIDRTDCESESEARTELLLHLKPGGVSGTLLDSGRNDV